MAMREGWRAIWGQITPWQTNYEEEVGLEGTWGSGEYTDVDEEGYTEAQRAYGYDSPEYWTYTGATTPQDILEGTDFNAIARDAQRGAWDAYGIEYDPETGERITATASDLSAQAKALSDELPSFTEWLADQGIALGSTDAAQAGLQALTEQLAAGPTDEDYDAGYANAARMMGLSPEEAEEMVRNLTQQVAAGPKGQQGISEEEMALRRRQNQSNIRMMEERGRRMIQDSLADTGSTARMLQAADEATMQINNVQIQQDAMLAQEDAERAFAQWQSVAQSQAQMVETRQMGVQQYISNMQQSIGMAMEGYSKQINAILAENDQYLNQYGADFNALQTQVENMYAAANLQLGIDQAAIQAMQDLYDQAVNPILDQVEALMLSGELDFSLEDFASLAADIAGTIAAFI